MIYSRCTNCNNILPIFENEQLDPNWRCPFCDNRDIRQVEKDPNFFYFIFIIFACLLIPRIILLINLGSILSLELGLILLIMESLVIFCLLVSKKQIIRDVQYLYPRLSTMGIFTVCLGYAFIVSSILLNIQIEERLINSEILNILLSVQVTVLAIIVSLSLLIIQIGSNLYTTRTAQIIKKYYDLWAMVGIYLSSIFYLITLNYLKYYLIYHNLNINLLLVKLQLDLKFTMFIAIFIVIWGFLLIIPYIYNILTIIRPENQLNIFQKEIIFHPNDKDLVFNHLHGIKDIVISSIKRDDILIAKDGIGRIRELLDYYPNIVSLDYVKLNLFIVIEDIKTVAQKNGYFIFSIETQVIQNRLS